MGSDQSDVYDNDKHAAFFAIDKGAVDFEAEFVDPVFATEEEKHEADRLINLVKGTTVNLSAR